MKNPNPLSYLQVGNDFFLKYHKFILINQNNKISGIIPEFVRFLDTKDDFLMNRMVWVLGNIALCSPADRDVILKNDFLPKIQQILDNGPKESQMFAASFLANLFTSKFKEENSAIELSCLKALCKVLPSAHTPSSIFFSC